MLSEASCLDPSVLVGLTLEGSTRFALTPVECGRYPSRRAVYAHILLHAAAGAIQAPRVEGARMTSLVLQPNDRVDKAASGWWWSGNCLRPRLEIVKGVGESRGSRALSLCPSPTPASMSAAFNFVRSVLFDLRDGLQPAHFNSADAETWLCKFSVALIATYSAAADCGIDLANDDPVDAFICEVNAWFQPFANEVWFLRYAQEVATVVAGHRQQVAERRTLASAFPQPRALGRLEPMTASSSRLSSAAVSPVLSLLTAGLPAAVLPVAASPSLLPLRQVQPTPSHSPAAVATTVPPSAPRTPGIADPAAPVASSGSRRAHFEEFGAAEGEDEELPWIRCDPCAERRIVPCFKCGDSCLRESDRYHKCFAQELAARVRRDPLPARAPRASRTPRVACAPSVADNFEPSWDPRLDPPGPAYDILVGGHFYFPGLESASAALFWCSEVVRAEGHYLAAKRHLQFARSMLSDSLTCCIAPSLDSSRSQRVQFSRPSTASADLDVTGPTDDVAPRGEGSSSGKGKGRAVVPMDEDMPGRPASPSDGGDSDGWDGILG
ncbi:hypothetical protein V8E53_011694 [Lactarius tabidus]